MNLGKMIFIYSHVHVIFSYNFHRNNRQQRSITQQTL